MKKSEYEKKKVREIEWHEKKLTWKRNVSSKILHKPSFFHHMVKVGFDPFLKEFYRILKKGGGIVILEPSLWYPLNIITRPIKRIFHNPYGEVEDEAPFPP